ncbi:MAG: alanine--tRNA ligase [Candidatus Atabeyarchaeum deiterrae]
MSLKSFKKQLKQQFSKDYTKFYPTETLKELGFARKMCRVCGNNFWTINPDTETCGDPSCVGGYRFIGSPPTNRKLSYKECWDEFVKVFTKSGHTPINRYPVVARWRDDVYFVEASIYDFQPHVVSGEVDPPANPLIVPQFVLRFNDVDNVGLTGRHYTGFIMVGQHVFNKPGKFIYFKDECVRYNYERLTSGLGIPGEEVTFVEDVWAGGGNFGPSIEYFVRGLELGNQVFMQYEQLPDGSTRTLDTTVIDHGTGLERYPWICNGTPTSYDVVFPKVLDKLFHQTGIKPNMNVLQKFALFSGRFDVTEIDDPELMWRSAASYTGWDVETLKKEISSIRALYSVAEHARSLLVAVHDGALPSNVGGGYNLRYILRRALSLISEYKLNVEFGDVVQWHIDEFGPWFTELRDVGSLFEILKLEKSRYEQSLEKGRTLVERLVKSKKVVSAANLVELYDSHGITPQTVKEIASGYGCQVSIPEDFTSMVEEKHFSKAEESNTPRREVPAFSPTQITGIPETIQLYYEQPRGIEFNARVLKIINGKFVILDKTMFYPTSGGQEFDTGTINGVKVVGVAKSGNIIVHELSKQAQIEEGTIVKGKIDLERRHALMRHHTATHILNASAREILGPHIWQAGAEKTTKRSRLDITHFRGLTPEEEKKIESLANKVVMENRPVTVTIMGRDQAEKEYGFRLYQGGAVPGRKIRVVEIKDFDVEACGGTHASSTGEVGLIKILSTERIQDGVVRLNFVAGEPAIEHMQKLDDVVKSLGALTGSSLDTVVKTIEKSLEERKEQNRTLLQFQGEMVTMQILKAASSTTEPLVKVNTTIDDLKVVAAIASKMINKELDRRALIIRAVTFAYGVSANDKVDIRLELSRFCRVVDGDKKEAKGFKLI